MFDRTRLHEALELLGRLLRERGHAFEVVAIGGGALLLLGMSDRTTVDLDIVARRRAGQWKRSRPLPVALSEAVAEVADALDMPRDKPWLNDGPSVLFELGLPPGWEARATTASFGALTIHLLGRDDLIALKLWAATDPRAPGRRRRDVEDLRRIRPTRDEFLGALRWCRAKDGSAGFAQASGVDEIAEELGLFLSPTELGNDHE